MILHQNAATVRHRVGKVVHVMDHGDSKAAIVYEFREFKTSEAANKYEASLQKQGHQTVKQHGVMVWLGTERATELINTLNDEGVAWE